MPTPQRCSVAQVLERLLVLLQILIFLGQRELQLHLCAPVGQGLRDERRKLGDVIALRALGAQLLVPRLDLFLDTTVGRSALFDCGEAGARRFHVDEADGLELRAARNRMFGYGPS